MDIRLLLSGTFGELRSNHFHSGIDIKTNGASGQLVYAIADGYVSRIKVSAYGFGKAIYITHPNGYVSVYAHLSRYNKTIDDYVKKAQYSRETFEIELFPVAGELPIKKRDIVAYSGNTGSSAGPHLHFEIRDEASQKPINPLLFGYEVKDFFTPRITSVKIYPEDANSRVNGAEKAIRYLVEGWGEEHRLAKRPTISLSGNVSFAIQVYDQQNDTDNKNGPYSIALYIDDELVYQYDMETFSFDETRYANSLLDYSEYVRNSARLQRTKIDPGNKLSIYTKVENMGVFHFNDDQEHSIKYEVKDVMGNAALLAFNVKSEKAATNKMPIPFQRSASKTSSQEPKFPLSNFNYSTPNRYSQASIIVDAPAGAFYDSFIFTYDTVRRISGSFSPVHKIHDKYTPIHKSISLSIRPVGLPVELNDKALIVKMKDDGKNFSSAGGKYERGYVVTRISEFGDYTIAVDTISPKITPVNPGVFTKMAGQKQIRLTITDKLTGIAGYRGHLNGKWILMEYDAKNGLLVYTIDETLVPGQNTLLVEVVDAKNNKSFFVATLIL